ASGVGTFLTTIGINFDVGKQFAALALSAFALTSLDTATRLARFIFQEFFSENKSLSFLANRYVSTAITCLCGVLLGLKGWAVVWPMFGSANQLLAALALIAVAVYLKKAKKNNSMLTIPTAFMFAVTLTALVLLVKANLAAGNNLLVFSGVVLFVLAVILLVQACKVLAAKTGDSDLKA
ncbi:MAG: carbon starvation protein A, partial [Peptococcaceae bacterium]|nr:carbon starvation protein A [Peptococcaceae bacterium]